jgi:hypothetical protein
VATRLYSTAQALKSDAMQAHALDDIDRHQRIQRRAFSYLLNFELIGPGLNRLVKLYGSETISVETRIEIARFLGDVRISGDTSGLVNSITGEILDNDIRMGSGYASSLLLLCLNKYGSKEHREKVRARLTLDRLQDDQLRLHHLYVFSCRNEIDEALIRAARHLDTPDIALLMRLCQDALDGGSRSTSNACRSV